MQTSLYTVDGSKLTLSLHPGQTQAWDARKRIVAVIAGSQSGKTSFAPIWLYREIVARGPGDYVYVCPTFALMEVKALPEFINLFEKSLRLGEFVRSPIRRFTFSAAACRAIYGSEQKTPTRIYFSYAENPESLESATYKAAVLDEAGQKSFKRDSWEAIQRRVAFHEGRIFIGTTPYSNAGWLRTEIYDRWLAGDQNIDFIRFASTMNPAFPRAEYQRAQEVLPPWKFRMFFHGEFERPAGLIYDCFDEQRHKMPRFNIPDGWQRYLGIDFGGVNTAAVYFAEEPGTGRLYLYREYKAGSRTAAEHAAALLAGEPMLPIAVGGSKSEEQWRAEFQAAGLPVREPAVTGPDSVEVGLDRVYGAIKRNELFVFGDLAGYLEEILTYSRELDSSGEPTEKIEDKSSYHYLDACRYIIGWVKGGGITSFDVTTDPGARPVIETAPPGVFIDLDRSGQSGREHETIRWPWQQ